MTRSTLVFPFLLITFFILLVSCESKDTRDIDSKLEMLTGAGYFPLHEGNFWELSSLGERTIDTTIQLDGYTWYRMVSLDTVFYWSAGNGKIYKRTASTDEILKFDLNAEVGETWSYPAGSGFHWNATLQSKCETVTLDNYEFRNCYKFFYDVPELADEEHSVWLAPDVGFVREEYLGGTSEQKILQKVIINGIEIEF